jgi:hypothetical protein
MVMLLVRDLCQLVQISHHDKHLRVDKVVPSCFGGSELVVQCRKLWPNVILPKVIVLWVRDKIEDIWSQVFNHGAMPPTVSNGRQETFLLLVGSSSHVVLGS